MGLLHPFRDRRRRELAANPFPPEWTRIVDRNVPYCRCLHPDECERLEELIKVFVHEKHFEGCAGVVMTDEIKVTIAAQACLLLLNLEHDYFERLVTILVYPEGFDMERKQPEPGGVVSETILPVSGVSSSIGVVVLSWSDTVHGAREAGDGYNVVFHEFAHQLDQLDGVMDGAPVLATTAMYQEWSQVLGAEYQRLQEEVDAGIPSLITPYGATRPAEFFAVVTELFFERPVALRREHPALYEEFSRYYRQDPAARLEECGAAE